MAYVGIGKFDRAIDVCRRALTLDPSLDWVHLSLSTALNRKGLAEEALVEAQAACAINPLNAEALYEAGWLFSERRAYHAALVSFERALRLTPNDTRIMEAAGMAHMNLHEYDYARRMFARATQLGPKYRRAWIGISMVEFTTGNWLSAFGALLKYTFGM
jgi:tetratricopeptide (TPR) repeat protein